MLKLGNEKSRVGSGYRVTDRNTMKILFVNNFRGRGGGEEFLRDLLPGLAAKGVQVGLVCRPKTPLVDMFKNSAIELYPIDRPGGCAG